MKWPARSLASLVVLTLGCRIAAAADVTMLAHAPTVASPRPPLIVLLHGAGADERDMIGLWRRLPPQFVVVSPRAPFGGGSGWRWYRKGPTQDADIAASRTFVDLVVANALERFDADPANVFVGGFSQGGVMTYEVVLHEPGRFRGAVVMSGSLFPSALAGDPAGPNATAFLIAHGTADKIIPFATAEAAQAKVRSRGLAVVFAPFRGMSHTVSDDEMAVAKGWLAERLEPSRDPPSLRTQRGVTPP